MIGVDNFIIFCAKYLIFIIGVIVLAVWIQQTAKLKREFALSIILAAVIALILVKLAAKAYYHPRPFVISGVSPLVPHSPDNGFPSEHATAAMALATVMYFYRIRLGLAIFVLAALVAAGRVWAHVHSPVDILGGIMFGIAAGITGYWLAKKLLDKKSKPPVV